jgi:hypothetical protein
MNKAGILANFKDFEQVLSGTLVRLDVFDWFWWSVVAAFLACGT